MFKLCSRAASIINSSRSKHLHNSLQRFRLLSNSSKHRRRLNCRQLSHQFWQLVRGPMLYWRQSVAVSSWLLRHNNNWTTFKSNMPSLRPKWCNSFFYSSSSRRSHRQLSKFILLMQRCLHPLHIFPPRRPFCHQRLRKHKMQSWHHSKHWLWTRIRISRAIMSSSRFRETMSKFSRWTRKINKYLNNKSLYLRAALWPVWERISWTCWLSMRHRCHQSTRVSWHLHRKYSRNLIRNWPRWFKAIKHVAYWPTIKLWAN